MHALSPSQALVPHGPTFANAAQPKRVKVEHTGAATSQRAKSNSERGKEFRSKRKKYEAELEATVYRLRTQVADLNISRSIFEKRSLVTRQSDTGSLVKLIREYFTMFRFGLRDPSTLMCKKRLPSSPEAAIEKIQRQELFLTQVMDEHVAVGDKTGPEASIAQWRLYTLSHESLRNEVRHITTSGPEDFPTVEVHSNVCVRISRDTFRFMFPGALGNEALMQMFLHQEVVYKSVFRFQFTPEGKIAFESADIGIVEGLHDAGFPLSDIAELMQQTVVTPQCMIPEPASISIVSSDPPRCPSNKQKFSLGFLLGKDEDELRLDERFEELVW